MTSLWKRQWALLAAALTLTVALVSFTGWTGTTAQGLDSLSGAPVDIHEGSCDDFLTEPAYDGGDLEVQSLSEVRDGDDFVESGLTEVGNTLGVDVNGDGELDDTETIGAADATDTEAAVAEADISDGVAEDGNWVAVVHASPDAYETTLACGSITEAAEDDDGNLVAYMHPVDDASAFGYAVLNGDRNHLDTYLFQPGQAPDTPAAAGADDATPDVAEGFPVGIHQGTCTDWTVEPAYDAGFMQVTNVGAEGEQEVGDTSVEVPEEAAVLGDVYHTDDEAEFNGGELLDEGPYVVAVHQSEQEYGTLVACGPVLDIPEDDTLMVPLVPVGDSNYTGMALIPQDEEEFTALLWQCEPIEQQEIPTPTPTPEPTPTPTPEPTVVIEETEVVTETEVVEVTEVVTETEVVEETEVITETEVVTAPTATALAQEQGEGGQPQEFELGSESPGDITAQAGETFTVTNTSENERTFQISDLGIDETIPAGESLEVTLPDEVEAGDYPYEVMEGDESVFEGNLTVE